MSHGRLRVSTGIPSIEKSTALRLVVAELKRAQIYQILCEPLLYLTGVLVSPCADPY